MIKVIAGRKKIDLYKLLSILNKFYDDFEIENYCFNFFNLTEIVSVKECYYSICLFKCNRL